MHNRRVFQRQRQQLHPMADDRERQPLADGNAAGVRLDDAVDRVDAVEVRRVPVFPPIRRAGDADCGYSGCCNGADDIAGSPGAGGIVRSPPNRVANGMKPRPPATRNSCRNKLHQFCWLNSRFGPRSRIQPTPDLGLRSLDARGSLLLRLACNYCANAGWLER